MYNEDKYLLVRIIYFIMKNVVYFCKREKFYVWGFNGWKKVFVILISDGRVKVN